MKRFTSVEAIIDAAAHRVLARLPQSGVCGGLVEFLVFGIKQAWACLFGGALLAIIMLTRLYWPEGSAIPRYDFLFLSAVAIQLGMLGFKLETWSEAKVILIFHIVGTVMEIFKTQAGSWIYPEPNVFRIGGVPLFSGFMYAAVGSYMARINRIFDIRLERYPSFALTLVLAMVIYANFFTHHFLPDIRIVLFAATVLLVALFIWAAENIGTWSRAWIYPAQADGWTLVSFAKFGSWYLLMIISVVLVTWIHPPRGRDEAEDQGSS